MGGDGRAFGRGGALVVGGGVAGCLSVDEWLHGFLVFAPSAGAFSCYLLSPPSKKNKAMDPRRRAASSCHVVGDSEQGGPGGRGGQGGGGLERGRAWARFSRDLTLYHSQSAAGQ